MLLRFINCTNLFLSWIFKTVEPLPRPQSILILAVEEAIFKKIVVLPLPLLISNAQNLHCHQRKAVAVASFIFLKDHHTNLKSIGGLISIAILYGRTKWP